MNEPATYDEAMAEVHRLRGMVNDIQEKYDRCHIELKRRSRIDEFLGIGEFSMVFVDGPANGDRRNCSPADLDTIGFHTVIEHRGVPPFDLKGAMVMKRYLYKARRAVLEMYVCEVAEEEVK